VRLYKRRLPEPTATPAGSLILAALCLISETGLLRRMRLVVVHA
jgi:hypothetical protein